MKAREPWRVKTGRTLSPSVIATNLRTLASDLEDSMARRYTYSTMVLDFSGIANTSPPSDLKYTFNTLHPYDIVGLEMVLYEGVSAAVTGVTMTITGSGVTGQETLTVAPAGATTKASGVKAFTASVTGTSAVTYTLSITGTGAFTIESCKVYVHVRTDRGSVSGAAHSPYVPSALPSPGDAVSRSALNTEFTAASTASTANTANDKCTRMEVYCYPGWRNIAAGALSANITDIRIPDSGRRLARVSAGVVCAATSSVKLDVLNAASASQLSVTLTGTGVSALATGDGTPGAASQPNSGLSTANDWTLRLSRNSGSDAIFFVYAVLYWT